MVIMLVIIIITITTTTTTTKLLKGLKIGRIVFMQNDLQSDLDIFFGKMHPLLVMFAPGADTIYLCPVLVTKHYDIN